MARYVIHINEDGKTTVKVREDILRKEKEEEKRKEEEKKKLDKKNINEKWLNEWLIERRGKRQKEFIEYLRATVPKERWDERMIRRFVSKIDVRSSDDCWEWLGSIDRLGYGRFWYDSNLTSHTLMYFIIYGEIAEGKEVCHLCNNRKCVNPNHLEEDTPTGNNLYTIICSRCPTVKLSPEDIKEIRERARKGEKQRGIAKDFGISESHMSAIIKRKKWKHI